MKTANVKKFICEHCFKESNQFEWNESTEKVFEDIKPVEKLKGHTKNHPYGERGFLFVCPKCNMTNESQFLQRVY